jgi:hypothetical protein
MTPTSPSRDSSRTVPLIDRLVDQVRGSLVLQAVLFLSLVDYAGAFLLALLGRIPWAGAGVLVALSALTWYFGLGLPLLNRERNARLGSERMRYWGEVVEMFGRVVVCAHAVLLAVMLALLAS